MTAGKRPNSSIESLLIVSIMLMYSYNAHSQSIIWRAGMHGFFDNREYFNSYTQDQTIFGTRTFGQAGFAFNQEHEFEAGVNYMYEFGSALTAKYLEPIMYYHFETEPVKLYIGSFERRNLSNLPPVLQSDTFQYYRPNIEGIFLEFRKPWGYQNGWLDWTSRQTNENKESFLIGGTGHLKKDRFFYRHDFIMTHYALTKNDDSYEHIRDNGGFCSVIGVDLSKIFGLDSITISTGFTMSYDRLRNIYGFEYYGGSLSEFLFQFKALGLHAITYFGDGQVQMVGDGLYRAKKYERVDLFWDLFRKGPLKGKVTFSFHFLDHRINYGQSFTIYLDLQGRKTLTSSASISDH